jgi:hypothetical protein
MLDQKLMLDAAGRWEETANEMNVAALCERRAKEMHRVRFFGFSFASCPRG